MSNDNTILIKDITVLQKQGVLQLTLADQSLYTVSLAKLRAYSPAADNKPPRSEQDFAGITVTAITPVGHYGIKLAFSDGHDTGIYRWEQLLEACQSIP